MCDQVHLKENNTSWVEKAEHDIILKFRVGIIPVLLGEVVVYPKIMLNKCSQCYSLQWELARKNMNMRVSISVL